jgi:tetratricopeptide (TPR) repeat protein
MSDRERLRQALLDPTPHPPGTLYELALQAYNQGLYAEIVQRLAPIAGEHAKLWQMLGLSFRAQQLSGEAHDAFARAAALAPADPLVAISLAHTALEAGYAASALFDRAQGLAPNDGRILIGRAAALVAEGENARALAGLAGVLAANPLWQEGHMAYARLAPMVGEPAIDATIRAALRQMPGSGPLWALLLQVLMQAHRHAEALAVIGQARAASGESLEWTRVEAICRSETGDATGAMPLFEQLPPPTGAVAAIHPIRALIRLGRFDEALRHAEARWDREDDLNLWPYRALLWRLTGNERWQWLEGDERLIGVYDLASGFGDLTAFRELLRALHRRTGEPIDQSVRGGSQTDGNLLARAEPEIRRLRAAILEAVAEHVAHLPPPVRGHPTLLANRLSVEVEGAWSVRLTGQGFHIDHVHPHGWFSSALYIALPDAEAESGNGRLMFGACRDLLPEVQPFRTVEPQVGRLVLFPSTMWHGTEPFAEGERISVAFDIARPPS